MQYYHAILDGGNITELQYRHCTLALNQDLLGSTPSSVTMKFEYNPPFSFVIVCIFIIFALLLGCFGQGNYLPEPVLPSDKNAKMLSANPTREYITSQDWSRSPWYRIDDSTTPLPVLLLIADDGMACLVDNKTWALAQPRKVVSCSKWRFPR